MYFGRTDQGASGEQYLTLFNTNINRTQTRSFMLYVDVIGNAKTVKCTNKKQQHENIKEANKMERKNVIYMDFLWIPEELNTESEVKLPLMYSRLS